jgi:hypothetical protein
MRVFESYKKVALVATQNRKQWSKYDFFRLFLIAEPNEDKRYKRFAPPSFKQVNFHIYTQTTIFKLSEICW